MILFISIGILLLISFVLAIHALSELDTPKEVKRLIRERKSKISGVIVFFKRKIVHYQSVK